MLHPPLRAIGALQAPLDAWMNDRRNVIRFLLVRLLLMAVMILAFGILSVTHQ